MSLCPEVEKMLNKTHQISIITYFVSSDRGRDYVRPMLLQDEQISLTNELETNDQVPNTDILLWHKMDVGYSLVG